jgi:hypothetical protein
MSQVRFFRHCERSEAIQARGDTGLPRPFGARNDDSKGQYPVGPVSGMMFTACLNGSV